MAIREGSQSPQKLTAFCARTGAASPRWLQSPPLEDGQLGKVSTHYLVSANNPLVPSLRHMLMWSICVYHGVGWE